MPTRLILFLMAALLSPLVSAAFDLHEAGTIAAVNTRAVNSPPVWGESRIVMLMPEGMVAAKGDTVAVLENERFANLLHTVSSDFEVQQRVLISVQAQNRSRAVAAHNAIIKAKLAMELATLSEENQRFAAPVQRQEAELSRRQAEISLTRSLQDSVAQAGIDSLGLARAELRNDRLQARMNRYKAYLDQLVLMAPADGMVVYHRERSDDGVKVLRQGDSVDWNQHLLDITDITSLKVEMHVHESDRGRVQVGQRVTAAPEAYPGRTYPGHITAVQSLPLAADAGAVSRVFLVTAHLDRIDPDLRPGMSVRATIHLEDTHARP